MPWVSLYEAARAALEVTEVTVPSSSRPGVFHTLQKIQGVWTCSCEGFSYQGHCKHVKDQEEKEK